MTYFDYFWRIYLMRNWGFSGISSKLVVATPPGHIALYGHVKSRDISARERASNFIIFFYTPIFDPVEHYYGQ